MIYVGTAVPHPRKSVQSVAKKDDNEFEKLTNGKRFVSVRDIRGKKWGETAVPSPRHRLPHPPLSTEDAAASGTAAHQTWHR